MESVPSRTTSHGSQYAMPAPRKADKAELAGRDFAQCLSTREVEATGVPPGGVRWKLETRYRPGLSGYRDVLLQSILAMCRRHKLTPLEIRHPPAVNGQHYVDVIFADGYEVNTAYDNDLTFEFYGTYPQPVSRGIPDFRHIAMCIQFLAADCDFKDVMAALHRNPRICQAGRVIGAWAIDRADTATFSGRLLVLLELHTHYGLVSVGARTAVPGWFVYQERSYLVRSANRLAWCANASCRMDEQGSFHSMHTCPHTRCITCGTQQHTSVDCPRRQAQVAPKKSAGGGANNGNAANAQPSSHLEAPATRGRGGRGGGRGRGRGRGRGGARSGGHGHMSSSAERLARNFDVLSLSDTTTSDYQQL